MVSRYSLPTRGGMGDRDRPASARIRTEDEIEGLKLLLEPCPQFDMIGAWAVDLTGIHRHYEEAAVIRRFPGHFPPPHFQEKTR